MDANELRALADALEPMARAPRFEDFDVPAFCAWLRACADEKPVGVYVHRPAELRYGVEWLVGDPMPDGTQLFTHPAPAAPQAEQPIDLDAVAMQQMRQAAAESTWMPSEYTSNDWIADVCRWLRDGPPAAAPQAEPKREPLTARRILEIEDDASRQWRDNGRIIEYAVVFARMIERELGIGGSDAE